MRAPLAPVEAFAAERRALTRQRREVDAKFLRERDGRVPWRPDAAGGR